MRIFDARRATQAAKRGAFRFVSRPSNRSTGHTSRLNPGVEWRSDLRYWRDRTHNPVNGEFLVRIGDGPNRKRPATATREPPPLSAPASPCPTPRNPLLSPAHASHAPPCLPPDHAP